ncbi:DUF1330 domain-containing protein [Mesorhizobium sp. B2-3-5]|uniref:DUF1330 domain-containing protein n=1 Tax=Mesorhizobium sp. B2-3-5 TaxID=2589958 RepID=UPI0011289522|nr:DUF1330 domain-containing protein [Mesorhizobium sp. B2-3-5]TPM26971.1 DUF1330 domain-containing protein [Mesorhizobium sp. B2-3-5]
MLPHACGFGERFLRRLKAALSRPDIPEGKVRSRAIVIEFRDYLTALDCWNSPEYAKAKALRQNVSLTDLVLVEGYDGPQPNES